MVAKSRPRRRPLPKPAQVDPDQWPDWVLGFPEPWINRDKLVQAARMIRFRQWRKDRDAWLVKTGVTWMAVHNEYRRRVDIWQAAHPKDRGPYSKG